MQFRTEYIAKNIGFNITHQNHILCIGSCFSENIGDELMNRQFPVSINPFGILFNPVSIENSIHRIINVKHYKEHEITQNGEFFFSYDHHSVFNDINQENILKNINDKLRESHHFLKISDFIFITLGSSYIHQLIENQKIVANCHKMLPHYFQKRLLSLSEIKTSLKKIISQIGLFNPNAKIIWTVSPVRHIKDGMVENNLSKSLLINALHFIIDQKNNYYFPAYEIMMDDLRDYRFYKSDLLHPNNQAISYIWDKFQDTFFNLDTINLNNRIMKLKTSLNHKPFNEDSITYKQFKDKLIQDINQINTHLINKF